LRRSRLQLCTSLLLVAGALSTAHADDAPVDVYKQTVERGSAKFERGDYVGARADFQAAYAIHPDAVLIFNIASTYRREGDRAKAIELYRAFLSRADAADPRRDLARHTIAELEDEIEAARKAERERREAEAIAEAKAAAERKAREEAEAEREAAHEAFADREPARRSGPRTSVIMKWSGGGLIGLGAVSTGLGVLAASDAAYAEDKVETFGEGDAWNAEQQAQYESGQAAARRARIFVGAGATMIVSGIVLYIVGERRAEAETLTIAPTADGASVSWSGRW
jgi:tetratricopeptide (TPR) repeat protein